MKLKHNISKLIMACAAILSLCMTSCRDEDLFNMGGQDPADTRAYGTNETGGLTKQSDGTWKATRRVPLVGYGRVVSNVSSAAVSAGALDSSPEALTDLDLTNYYSPQSAIVGADVAANQIASVRDLNHTYSGGQKVGFLCKSLQSSVLELKVLKGFWIDTYKNGERVEGYSFTESTSVLDLGVGNIAGGNTDNTFVIEHEFTEPFDEVRIGLSGVEADVVKQMGIYYAYVGENPMMPAVNKGDYSWYFGDKVSYVYEGSYTGVSLKKLIDSNLDNGIEIGTVSNLFQPHMTIDFGREIPAGSEVGWYLTSGSVLNLDLGGTVKVTTFDEEGNALDSYSYTKILDLGLLGGGKSIFSLITQSPCRRIKLGFYGVKVDLGAKLIHYAFVREATEVDESSYFSAKDAVVYNPNYLFGNPYAGNVKYTLVDSPAGASATVTGNGIYGMNVLGDYQILATYTSPDGAVVTEEFTVTRKANDNKLCEDAALVNKDDSEWNYTTYVPENNSLTIGGTLQDGMYKDVVDSDLTNKVTLTTTIGIEIGQGALIGVKSATPINTNKENVRVGFVVDNNSTFLKADVLKFFRIKLKKGEKEVESSLANGAISVGLIKDNDQKQTLTRLSINTNEEFDAVELYASQPLAINVATSFGIYYAFCEKEDMDCSNPGIDCMQLITNANSGATVSWKNIGGVSVAAVCTNLDRIVDDDYNSCGTIVKTVDVATATEVSVKFNTIKASSTSPQQVGFILKNDVDIIKLIGVTQVQAYYKGEQVAEKTSFGILDVELTNDKVFYPITVEKDFDELRLVIGSGLGVGKGFNICGVYMKPDLDGDGIIDCVGDFVESGLKGFKVSNPDVCVGDVPEFSVLGAQNSTEYTLAFYRADNETEKPNLEVKATVTSGVIKVMNEDELQAFFDDEENAGIYSVRFGLSGNGDDQVLSLTIHPKKTTWTGKASQDWNDWDNWDNGVPWDCTDVVLPTPAKLTGVSSKGYPVLDQEDTYYCQNIHFETGAVIKGQNRLKSSGITYIDMELAGGDYHLISAPLQGMVTGDMFLTSSDWTLNGQFQNGGKWSSFERYFTPLNADNYVEKRVNPVIYQRFWSKKVQNQTLTRSTQLTTQPEYTDWSRSFNAVTTAYVLGQGFAVRVGAGNDAGKHIFHFPKTHSTYGYYNLNGEKLKDESFTRSKSNGKLMHGYGNFMSSITLTRLDEGNKFLLGNPFMGYIDIAKFLEANTETVTAIQTYEGDGKYTPLSSGTIAPMQAVFISAKTVADRLQVKFTQDMIKVSPKTGGEVTPAASLQVTAAKGGHSSRTTIGLSGTYSNAYDAREDITIMIGGEVRPEVALFSIADNKALAVQCAGSATRIPLGLRLEKPGTITLSFSFRDNVWNSWELVDSKTGKHHSLSGKFTIENVESGDDRFYLHKKN